MVERLKNAFADPGELFGVLASTAVDGIVVIDEFGTVHFYNDACRRLFQFEPAEVRGKNVKMLMPAPYRQEHDGYIARYKETGAPHIIGIGREVSGLRKDGTEFPMLLSVGEGALGGHRVFVGIIHDLTAIRKEQAQATMLQAELAHVARLNAIAQLSSALAHELNQPLTAIMNYAGAAKKRLQPAGDPNAERASALLDKTLEQAERAGQVIQRLRAFLEKREPTRTEDDLNDIVREAVALGFVGSTDEGVTLTIELESNLPPVDVDRIQIEQVLVNLVRNAAEAMRGGERQAIEISTRLSGPGHVEVAVADSGPGMPDDVAAKLFEPFVTTKEKGMGVGLSISRSIIEAHGGRIWMTPNPAGGAIFRFQLPVAT